MTGNQSSGKNRLRILILSRDPQAAAGGVANFVRTEIGTLSSEVESVHFQIGRRTGETSIKTIKRLIDDPFRLRQVLKKEPINIVQLNPSLNVRSLVRDFFFCVIANRRPDLRVAVVFHGWDSNIARRISNSKILRYWFSRSFGAADCFVVLAKRFAAEAIEMGVPESSIHKLTTLFDDEEMSEFRDFPDGKKNTVLFMSRLVKEKGAAELIEAFANGMNSNWPDWNLIIAGDGPQRSELEDTVAREGLGDRVAIVGYVVGSKKFELLEEASIFALPTRYNEGIPISVVEAMSAGCALLTTTAGGLGDVITDGENGVVLQEQNSDEVFRGLTTLISNSVFLASAQNTCHRLAWSRLSSTHVIGRLEKLLLGGHN
jgi:glycosyltransferase involved in cell wall biosynthesis